MGELLSKKPDPIMEEVTRGRRKTDQSYTNKVNSGRKL